MAAHPPAAGVAKVTFNQECSGRGFGDSLYFQHTDESSWTVAQLTTLATNAGIAYNNHVLPLQNVPLTFVSITALDLSDTVGREAVVPDGAAGGGVGTQTLPLNSVARITFGVPRRYRGGRPGYNVSCLDRTMLIDEKQFNPATIGTVLTAIVDVASDVVGGVGYGAPIFQAAVSYFTGGAPRIVPLVLPIIRAEIQQRLCNLRKRLGKGISG